ncbi:MAG: hypothetical protein KDC26_03395 [Armatimonadetes bacterium]|nr:hypothetical protein [Armatimonadota bacterium]
MKHALRLITLVGLMLISMMAFAQVDNSARATEMGRRVHQLNLLNQVLPVLMTKEQIKKLLPVMEKQRQAVKDLEKREFDQMSKIDAKVQAALKDAKEKQVLPSDELNAEIQLMAANFNMERIKLLAVQINELAAAMEEHLNAGQIKSAAMALNPKIYNPEVDDSQYTEKERLLLWVRYVLMDPEIYPLMIELSK